MRVNQVKSQAEPELVSHPETRSRHHRRSTPHLTELYALRPSSIWAALKAESFAFWMSCCYLFFEYVRPQKIWTFLDAYPYWGRTFAALALLGWIADSKRVFVWTRISTGVVLFLVIIVVSSMFAYWPSTSWANLMGYFNWVVVFFALTLTVTNRQRVFILLLVFFVASFKLSQYGARTWAMQGFAFSDWGLRGPQGYFENPGELAIQMVVFAPMALYFLLGVRPHLKRWQKLLLLSMPLTAALTVLGTNTRGGQLAMLAQLLVVVAGSRHRVKTFVLMGIVLVAGYQLLPEEQKARFESMGSDGTSQQRLLYWEHGWQMMKDHPFLGVGYFNFIQYYAEHHREDLVLPQLSARGYGELPHNIFVQVGTDTGFTGLSLFLLLIGWGWSSMRRLQKEAERRGDAFYANMAQGMNLALVGYVVAGQFVTVAYYPFLWIHLAFCVAMEQSQRANVPKSRVRSPAPGISGHRQRGAAGQEVALR